MSEFTFEHEGSTQKLETFEWDNVWLDHPDNTETPRVLYIGDSISCALRRPTTVLAEEAVLFDGFGTSKALDNPYFKEALLLFAGQQGRRELVLLNNGLHGAHLDDEAYERYYEDMVQFLRREFHESELALVLTTYTRSENWIDRVKTRNEAVCRIAEKYGLPVIDLYTPSVESADLLSEDKVHFTSQGYQVLAQVLLSAVNDILS
ncbi:MAG: SGNH/GDSL hydrolase family protein [Clostridia bacterium]|nr:SGNH/GDSL hydrolase family protein [Clostridia bacterium]